MYPARLTRVANGVGLRSDSVTGLLTEMPLVGNSMQLLGEPLDPQTNVRLVTTSPVTAVARQPNGSILVTTENSTYCVELLTGGH